MTFIVHTVTLSTGDRLPFLIDESSGIPLTDATAFAMRSWRKGLRTSTIGVQLRAIARGLEWAEARGIDLRARIREFSFLKEDEREDLAQWLSLQALRSTGTTELGFVRREVLLVRWLYLKKYLLWLATNAMSGLDGEVWSDADEKKKAFEEAWDSETPRSTAPEYGTRLGLKRQARLRFLDVIRPNSPENPFDPQHRLRNYALLLLYFSHPLRLSEALALKIGDIEWDEGVLRIVHRPGDKQDPRKEQPVPKTGSRTLHLEKDVLLALEACKEARKNRAVYPESKRHPFLFVAEGGQPIARRTVADLFKILRKKFPELGPRFSAHILRHDWNDRWIEDADRRRRGRRYDPNFDGKDEDSQRYANGWSRRSRMPMRYAQQAISKRTAKLTAKVNLQYKGMLEDPKKEG